MRLETQKRKYSFALIFAAPALFTLLCTDCSKRDNSEKEKLCVAGDAKACINLAKSYENSQRLKSIKYYHEACKLGNAKSCLTSGMNLYLDGDLKKGRDLLAKSCRESNVMACELLANVFNNESRYRDSIQVHELACKLGSAYSCERVANRLLISGHPDNDLKALTYKELACKMGLELSCTEVIEIKYRINTRERMLRTPAPIPRYSIQFASNLDDRFSFMNIYDLRQITRSNLTLTPCQERNTDEKCQ